MTVKKTKNFSDPYLQWLPNRWFAYFLIKFKVHVHPSYNPWIYAPCSQVIHFILHKNEKPKIQKCVLHDQFYIISQSPSWNA